MIKKSLFSLFAITFMQFFLNCVDCDCPSPKLFKFDFDQMNYLGPITKPNVINEVAFTIKLKDSSNISMAKNTKKGSFISSALACKCSFENYGILKSPIKNIKIFTINELNKNYKAGSDVSDLFVGLDSFGYSESELYYNLSTLKTRLNNQNYSIKAYLKEYIQTNISFYLKEKQVVPVSLFKVQISFENDSVLETTTNQFLQK